MNDTEKILQEYGQKIVDGLEAEQERIAKETVERLKKISPKGRRKKYAKGWKYKKDSTTGIITIYNTEYRLIHLLEYGHALKNGGRTKAQPHVSTEEKRLIREFEERMNEIIRK